MRLWFYNNVMRHYYNWRYRGHGMGFGRAAKITPEAIKWAEEAIARHVAKLNK